MIGAGLSSRGELEEAERCLKVALFLDDEVVSFWTDLGHLCIGRNDFARALPCFQRARALGDSSFAVLLNTATCAYHAGNHDLAYTNYGLALRTAPDHPHAEDMKAMAAHPSQGDPRYVLGDDWLLDD